MNGQGGSEDQEGSVWMPKMVLGQKGRNLET